MQRKTLSYIRQRLSAVGLTACLLFVQGPVRAGWDDGVAAYERGDFVVAVKEFRPFAEQGNATAQFIVGMGYNDGYGIPKDYKQAIKWYRLASEQGHALAQFNLGVMHENGRGVPQDYLQAAKWYRLAANQGETRAQYNLGVLYDHGTGVPRDYQQATKWYRLAANQGHTKAQYNLSVMYYMGKGVPQNRTVAYALASVVAAVSGDEKASADRDVVLREMTRDEVAAGQALAREMFKPGNLLKALDAYLAK